jgi:phage-related protein
MAIGFTTTGTYGSRAIKPDKGLRAAYKPRTLIAQFGDGYQQRVLDGINNSPRVFNVNFKTRTKAEIDDIAGYFNSLNGVTKFNFTVPDEVEGDDEDTVKVICTTWNKTYDYGDYYSLTATFNEVFEA